MSRDPGTAERILQAADGLFAARGFSGVSVRDIAEAAGVTKALVFYHHTSKARLFETVLGRYYEAHRRALAEGAAGGGDRGARLHRMLDAYLDFLEENHRYVQLVQRELASGSEALAIVRQGLTGLYRWVGENLGDLVPPEGPLSAPHFFVSFSGLAVTYGLYAPVLEDLFQDDPLRPARRRERRAHLHWVLDTLISRLETERPDRGRPA